MPAFSNFCGSKSVSEKFLRMVGLAVKGNPRFFISPAQCGCCLRKCSNGTIKALKAGSKHRINVASAVNIALNYRIDGRKLLTCFTLIIKITIPSIVIGSKNSFFSTNSLVKLLSDSSISQSHTNFNQSHFKL